MKIAFAYDSSKGRLEQSPRYRRLKAWAEAADAEIVPCDVADKPISGVEVTHVYLDDMAG